MGAQVQVRWITASADYQQHFRYGDLLATQEPFEEWQLVEEYVTVEEGEFLAELIFVATGSGVFWCDDVRIDEIRSVR